MASPDGLVAFCFERTGRGVYVERTHRIASRARATYAVLFGAKTEFERFCDTDDLRFAYPLVYHQAKTAFDDLFDGGA